MKHRFIKIIFMFTSLAVFMACKQESKNQDALIKNLIDKSPNPLENFELIDLNCDNINNLLIEIFIEDQDVRHTGTRDRKEVDAENLQKFVSLVEKCGFPTQDELTDYRSKYAVFLTLQHSSPEWIAYYLSLIHI